MALDRRPESDDACPAGPQPRARIGLLELDRVHDLLDLQFQVRAERLVRGGAGVPVRLAGDEEVRAVLWHRRHRLGLADGHAVWVDRVDGTVNLLDASPAPRDGGGAAEGRRRMCGSGYSKMIESTIPWISSSSAALASGVVSPAMKSRVPSMSTIQTPIVSPTPVSHQPGPPDAGSQVKK